MPESRGAGPGRLTIYPRLALGLSVDPDGVPSVVELRLTRGKPLSLESRPAPAYTNGMKTAVTIPDAVFQAGERLAKRTRKSRSQLYADALAEYLVRHSPDEVTAAMDRAIAAVGDAALPDRFHARAARAVLERSEW